MLALIFANHYDFCYGPIVSVLDIVGEAVMLRSWYARWREREEERGDGVTYPIS